ncbi:MAG: hypothetical protein ACYSUL_09660 [Planctomycetota bacterium]
MESLLVMGEISLYKCSKHKYYNNLTAAYLVLIKAVLSRKISRELRFKAGMFTESYLIEKDSSIYGLYHAYNSAFSSSPSDGLKPMAKLIAQNVTTKDPNEFKKFFYTEFYTFLEIFKADLRGIKIVS